MELTERQKLAYGLAKSPVRFIFYRSGSRSEKSFMICYLIFIRALNTPHSRHGIFRQTAVDVRATLFDLTFRQVMEAHTPGLWDSLKKSGRIKAAGGNVASLPQDFAAVAAAHPAPSWDTFTSGGATKSRDGQAMDQILAGPALLKDMGMTGTDLDNAVTLAEQRFQQKLVANYVFVWTRDQYPVSACFRHVRWHPATRGQGRSTVGL